MNPCNLMKALVSMRMSMKLNFFCLHPRSGIPRSSLKENDSATVVVHSLWLRARYWGTRGWTSLISKTEIKLIDPATPEQNGGLACRGYPAIWHCKIHGSAKTGKLIWERQRWTKTAKQTQEQQQVSIRLIAAVSPATQCSNERATRCHIFAFSLK